MKKLLLTLFACTILAGCDSVKTTTPTSKVIYEFIYYKSFYTDMSRTGWFSETFSLDAPLPWRDHSVKFSGLRTGQVTHTVKDQLHHYVTQITFTIADSTKGLEVAGEIRYYRGLVDEHMYWESEPWKQTGAKKIGKW